MDYIIRRYKIGDEKEISHMIKKDMEKENIKDYSMDTIRIMIDEHNEDVIRNRALSSHAYVLLDGTKIIGVGMVAPHRDNPNKDVIFLTIFIDPNYKGKGIGRKIIETLEEDEYSKNADRIEIPASLSALEFYKHFGYGFKDKCYISNKIGEYRLEKYPKISNTNVDLNQYNMRPYIDNEYHNYKEFIYQVKKNAYKKYVEDIWGTWNEEVQRKLFNKFIEEVQNDTYIIQLNGKDIGFYNGKNIDDNNYEIGNICIIPEYQNKNIGTKILNDIIELHKNQTIHIQYFKQNPVGKLYEKLGFIQDIEKEYHYTMIKK